MARTSIGRDREVIKNLAFEQSRPAFSPRQRQLVRLLHQYPTRPNWRGWQSLRSVSFSIEFMNEVDSIEGRRIGSLAAYGLSRTGSSRRNRGSGRSARHVSSDAPRQARMTNGTGNRTTERRVRRVPVRQPTRSTSALRLCDVRCQEWQTPQG